MKRIPMRASTIGIALLIPFIFFTPVSHPTNRAPERRSSDQSTVFTTDPFVVGGFDASRGGFYSFPSGTFLNQARSSLTTNFPGVSFVEFSTLTPAALAGVDVLVISSASSNTSHVTPLSTAEQSALLGFVQGGGRLILFPDNDSFGGAETPAANESLIDPFDMNIAGTLSGTVIASVGSPSASPITSGPFGIISSFSQNYSGGLTDLGPLAASLATNSFGSALAVVQSRAISSGSGRVVVFTDINTFGDPEAAGFFPDNEALFLNTIEFCRGVGPPTNKDQCENGGWRTVNAPRAFKNQGDCIQFVNTGK